jgi:ankyrin repeat protein
MLLNANTDPNVKDPQGRTALDAAAEFGNKLAVDVLKRAC